MLIHSENRDLTQIVIGAAMKVLNTLNPGLDEKLYERALVIELKYYKSPHGSPAEYQACQTRNQAHLKNFKRS